MSGANVRRLRGGMEGQWQLPFIFRALAVNKYDRAHLSWQSSDEEPRGCRLNRFWAIWLIQIRKGAGIKTATRKGKKDRDREWERERGQSCGGHILQRHFYYFTTALGKEAALRLCRTHSTNDKHWGNSANIGEWASNVQGETKTFFYLFLLPILFLVCRTRHVSFLNTLWSQIVQITLDILV